MNSNIRSQRVNGLIALAMGLGMTLVACQVDGEKPRQGRIELAIDNGEAACLDGALAGGLVLTSMENGSETMLPAQTFCTATIRRELPAGLYSLSWCTGPLDDTSAHWQVRDPIVLGVLPGDVTRVSVRTLPEEAVASLGE